MMLVLISVNVLLIFMYQASDVGPMAVDEPSSVKAEQDNTN